MGFFSLSLRLLLFSIFSVSVKMPHQPRKIPRRQEEEEEYAFSFSRFLLRPHFVSFRESARKDGFLFLFFLFFYSGGGVVRDVRFTETSNSTTNVMNSNERDDGKFDRTIGRINNKLPKVFATRGFPLGKLTPLCHETLITVCTSDGVTCKIYIYEIYILPERLFSPSLILVERKEF